MPTLQVVKAFLDRGQIHQFGFGRGQQRCNGRSVVRLLLN